MQRVSVCSQFSEVNVPNPNSNANIQPQEDQIQARPQFISAYHYLKPPEAGPDKRDK